MRLQPLMVLLLSAHRVVAQEPVVSSDEVLDQLVVRGIEYSLRQEYDEARLTFEETARVAPFHPAGYLYQAGLLQTRAVDFQEGLPRDQFDSLLSRAAELADRWIMEPDRRALGYYYRGTVAGYRSYAASYEGSWLEALTEGLSAVKDLQRSVQLDPSLYDAYAGIGTYYYWKSRKLEFLSWLRVIQDDREEGMRLLRLNISHGKHNKYIALNSLVEICLDGGRLEEALKLVRTVLREYPGNRLFRWLEGRTLERLGRHPEAAAVWGSLLDEYSALRGDRSYPVLVARIKLARALMNDDHPDEARRQIALARQAWAQVFPEHVRRKLDDREAELKKLEDQLAGRSGGSR